MLASYTANATLTYELANATGYVLDEDTGVYRAAPGQSTTQTLTASLEVIESVSGQTNLEAIPGVDNHSAYLEGRLISPIALPAWYKPGLYLNIVFSPANSPSITGRFYTLISAEGKLGTASVFGPLIAGVIVDKLE